MKKKPEMMVSGEVARVIGVSKQRIHQLADAGRLAHQRTGSGVRIFQRRDVEALAKKRAQEAR
jgi:excisionase family DNA binding protein